MSKTKLNALVTLVCMTLLACKGHKTVASDLLAQTGKTAEELWPGVQEAQKRSLVTISGQTIRLTPAGVECAKATEGKTESAKAEAPPQAQAQAPEGETFPQKMARLKREKKAREQAEGQNAQASVQQTPAQGQLNAGKRGGRKGADEAPKAEAQAPKADAPKTIDTLDEGELRERLGACQAEITVLAKDKPLVAESLTRMVWAYKRQLRKRFGA